MPLSHDVPTMKPGLCVALSTHVLFPSQSSLLSATTITPTRLFCPEVCAEIQCFRNPSRLEVVKPETERRTAFDPSRHSLADGFRAPAGLSMRDIAQVSRMIHPVPGGLTEGASMIYAIQSRWACRWKSVALLQKSIVVIINQNTHKRFTVIYQPVLHIVIKMSMAFWHFCVSTEPFTYKANLGFFLWSEFSFNGTRSTFCGINCRLLNINDRKLECLEEGRRIIYHELHGQIKNVWGFFFGKQCA